MYISTYIQYTLLIYKCVDDITANVDINNAVRFAMTHTTRNSAASESIVTH